MVVAAKYAMTKTKHGESIIFATPHSGIAADQTDSDIFVASLATVDSDFVAMPRDRREGFDPFINTMRSVDVWRNVEDKTDKKYRSI